MTVETSPDDAVAARLQGLATSAPTGLTDAVFDRWVRTPGPFGDVYAAFGTHGIRFLRTAGHVGDDPRRFAADYRTRWSRPLVPGEIDPAGLREALAADDAAGSAPAVDLVCLSAFESAVLGVVRGIPAGETRPYSWVAREAGRPAAVRAAGTVLARNPVPLLVPCHRVTRADGALGHYMFGTEHKEMLLRREDATGLDRARRRAARGDVLVGDPDAGTFCFPTCHRAADGPAAVGFRTTAAARLAGFGPCPRCRPALPDDAG